MRYVVFALVMAFWLVFNIPGWMLWNFRLFPRNWLMCEPYNIAYILGVVKWDKFDYDPWEKLYYDYKGAGGTKRYPYTNKN